MTWEPYRRNAATALGGALGAATLSIALIFPMASLAQPYEYKPLEEVQRSPLLHQLNQRATPSQEQWLPPGSNFARLFTEHQAAKEVLDWAQPTTVARYDSLRDQVERFPEGYRATRQYLVGDAAIHVSIFVLHPRFRNQQELGLIKEFAQLEPPTLQVQESREIPLHDDTARFFIHRSGECSLLLPTARDGRVQLLVRSCTDEQQVVEFARTLNIRRLNRKLMS